MAKRKRLGPVDAFAASPGSDRVPETKSALAPAPIASVAGDAAAVDALARVSSALEAARAEGRLVQKIPLDQVVADHLIRDRITTDETEMEALKESLRNRGQQTPIEVVELAPDRFGLISGWRRLHALRALKSETVLARLITPGTEADAYVAMVEENEIRVGLSYYERARIVLRAEQEGVYPTRKAALQSLFANVSRAKRSKIGSFVTVVEALDETLRFPTELGERLGLQLAKAIEAGRTRDLTDALKEQAADAAREQELLRRVIDTPDLANLPVQKPVRAKPPKPAPPQAEIEMNEADGEVRLSGPGVTDGFKAALRAWLAKRD